MNSIPKIAERIKFWEEQDRINKAIIPRLLKNHELIVDLSKQQALYSNHIMQIEVRTKKLETTINKDNRLLFDLSNKQASLSEQITQMESRLKNIEAKFERYNNAPKKTLLFSIIAILIAVLSLLLVILK